MEQQHPPSAGTAHITFGELLRHLRRQAYMTQRDLALATGYSIGQICRFEQNQCVPDLATVTARFIPALVDPSDTASQQRLLAFARTARATQQETRRRQPSPALTPATPGAGPVVELKLAPFPCAPTPLLGRGHEVSQICAMLRQPSVRLLTLTGAPGIGKTRLGLQVAAELKASFADGVTFVPLAAISDPALVPTAVAQALGITERTGQSCVAALTEALHARRLLLVLDNFEHVLATAPLVARLLANAPGLVVIVTSRAALRIGGEHEVLVPPLALPPLDPLPELEELALSPAVQLFIARARAVHASFTASAANLVAIGQICARLDGLPLAIELAAARVKLFPPQALLARLERRLQLLTAGARDLPARQQTLRDTIDWSYRLLDPDGRRLLGRLGVFASGWTLETIEVVCGASDEQQPQVLDKLAELVDQSLVQQVEGLEGQPRFTMLETIREYALERLEESGELEALRRRHADAYLTLAEADGPRLIGAQQGGILERLDAEHDNMRTALQWALERRDGSTAGRMGAALASFWYARSYLSEGRAWLEQALALLDEGAPVSELRARVLSGAGMLAYIQGDYEPARARLEESVALARASGDQPITAAALDAMGWAALVQGDHASARPCFEEGLALSMALGQSPGIAVSFASLASAALVEGDYARASTYCEKGLALGRAISASPVIGLCLATLGSIALVQGNSTRAQGYYVECLTLAWKTGHKLLSAVCLIGLAGAAAAQRQASRAARLASAGDALLRANGIQLPPVARPHYELLIAAARFQLGEAAYTENWAAGQALSLEQVVAEALSA